MRIIAQLSILLITLTVIYCKSGEKSSTNETTKKNGVSVKNDNAIEKKYLDEGFIDSNTFRVIILSDSTYGSESESDVEHMAKKRTRISLQKFLLSKNRKIDQNTKAKILGLINKK